jgi:hypothetical protein
MDTLLKGLVLCSLEQGVPEDRVTRELYTPEDRVLGLS